MDRRFELSLARYPTIIFLFQEVNMPHEPKRIADPGGHSAVKRNRELADGIRSLAGVVRSVTWYQVMPNDPQGRAGWVVDYEAPTSSSTKPKP